MVTYHVNNVPPIFLYSWTVEGEREEHLLNEHFHINIALHASPILGTSLITGTGIWTRMDYEMEYQVLEICMFPASPAPECEHSNCASGESLVFSCEQCQK